MPRLLRGRTTPFARQLEAVEGSYDGFLGVLKTKGYRYCTLRCCAWAWCISAGSTSCNVHLAACIMYEYMYSVCRRNLQTPMSPSNRVTRAE